MTQLLEVKGMDLIQKRLMIVTIKLSFMLFLLCLLAVTGGCSESFVFPSEKDFSLTASVSKTTLRIGEDLMVEGVFKNLTDSTYKLSSGASFSDSGLIHINMYNLDEEEMIMVGSEVLRDVKGNEEVFETSKIKMDKVGKYKVVVSSNFDITNSKNSEKRSYNIRADKIIIEVIE